MPTRRKAPSSPPDDPLARAYELLLPVEAIEEDDLPADADGDLVMAAYFGDARRVTAALEAGASPDARQAGTGFPALWLAVAGGHLEVVRILAVRGANPNAKVTARVGRETHVYTPLSRA